jgi:hypothetical protein
MEFGLKRVGRGESRLGNGAEEHFLSQMGVDCHSPRVV